MGYLDEKLSEQFYNWELRGRGWQVFNEPVSPEPPFRPFQGHYILSPSQPVDDGRKPNALSSFVDRLRGKLAPEPIRKVEEIPVEEEPEPSWFHSEELQEISISLPANLPTPREIFEQFLLSLSTCRHPISFELIGTSSAITPLFVAHPADARVIRRQLGASFPEAIVTECQGKLAEAWQEGFETAIVEFGLSNEFMLPLSIGKLDGLVGLTGAISELDQDETGLLQVFFEPVRSPWGESMLRAVTDNEGDSFFVNRPEMLPATREKLSRPLFAGVVRLAARSGDFDRSWQIIRDMAGPLSAVIQRDGNELIPLHNKEYPLACHREDVLLRQSRRTGMLLNSEELLAFVHLPSAAVVTPKLARQTKRTKAAPKLVQSETGLILGHNGHGGKTVDVRLSPDQRSQHIYCIGVSGTGKSTLLFNLIRQDIESGQGIAVLDPHGDLIKRILGIIPEGRTRDVLLLDPSDEEYSIGFNILSAHSDLEKTLLASDLVSVFERLSTSWGDQMSSVLRNAILAFLESDRGGTLADLRRFLLDASYRNEFLKTVRDPEIVYYWQKAFTQLTGNKSIGPVMTRLDTFLSPKPIRYMVSQRVNRLDFAEIMDGGKILLAKLPQGQIGHENAYLLGSLLVAKFQQAAISRQRMNESERRFFSLYVDEFHHFITPSMADILSGARKYRVGLVLAHQELRQLERDPEVSSAVLSNPYTRIVFRVGDADARKLSEGFSTFEAKDIQSLGKGEALCRVERSDFDFNLSVTLPEAPDADAESATRERVTRASREQFASPRAEIEAMLRESLETQPRERVRDVAVVVPAPIEVKPATPESAPEPIKQPEIQPTPKAEAKTSQPTPDMGRGGVQHQAIQQRLKAVAEGLGFRATIEKPVLDGQGSIDLVLEKPGHSIACEINVTSTIDYEVGNVTKCLRAGFARVAVICPRPDRLARLSEAVNGCVSPEEASKIIFLLPEDFIAHLQSAIIEAPAPPETSPPTEKLRRGYKVRSHYVEVSPEEAKAKEEAAIKMLAEKMRTRSATPNG
jgi:hypothetical protein